MITLSLCVSDIPKGKIYKSNNGKSYITLVVTEMKERDKFENTHTCYVSQSKEEKGNDKIYVGKGREIVFNNNQEKPKPNVSYQQPKPEPMPEASSEPLDDLPF